MKYLQKYSSAEYKAEIRAKALAEKYLEELQLIAKNDTAGLELFCVREKLVKIVENKSLSKSGRKFILTCVKALAVNIMFNMYFRHADSSQALAALLNKIRQHKCRFFGSMVQCEILNALIKIMNKGVYFTREDLAIQISLMLRKIDIKLKTAEVDMAVQLLYRGNCFKEISVDGKTYIQLKEEVREYNALRLWHDTQIVQIASESGLRMSLAKWSFFLFDSKLGIPYLKQMLHYLVHAPGVNELKDVIQAVGDPCKFMKLLPYFTEIETLNSNCEFPSERKAYEKMASIFKAMLNILKNIIEYNKNGEDYTPECRVPESLKVTLCIHFSEGRNCLNKNDCLYSHSEIERQKCIATHYDALKEEKDLLALNKHIFPKEKSRPTKFSHEFITRNNILIYPLNISTSKDIRKPKVSQADKISNSIRLPEPKGQILNQPKKIGSKMPKIVTDLESKTTKKVSKPMLAAKSKKEHQSTGKQIKGKSII